MSFTCPNVSHGCTESALSSSCFEEHRKECAYEQLSCPNHRPECQPFFRKDLEKHERECASYVCPYAYEGCPFISTAEKIKTHCEAYCGRLHQSIQDLTKKVDELRQQIQNTSPGQIQSLLPVAASDSPAQLTKESQDTSMSEMALFHEMFNSHLFDPLESDTAPDTQAIDSLTDFGSLDFLKLFSNTSFSPSTTSSPQPLTFVPPKTVPKRTTHGKKIRYSKDVRLAHGALRMARERTAQTTSEQPNDYALNSTRQKQPLCRNIEDSKSKKKPANSFVEPSQDLAPKRRPMFVLASSYLSNYNLPSVD
ncbi:hypothetical protein BY458DRAFT_516674 [Sporodiniella umbellata]|nr:hypothetical protein BY458DRAFT_516674 [Sporodiniella umbellata]